MWKKHDNNRKNEASGGCCFFDIKNINISNIYTEKCKTSHYGHAFFCIIPLKTESHINCISDFSSGQTASPYSTIHIFDRGNFFLNDINMTHSKNIKYPGTFHIGSHPEYSSIKYLNVVFHENEGSMSFTLSIKDDGNSESQYGHIENATDESRGGIIGFLDGSHVLKNFDFIQCSGNLVYNPSDRMAEQITFNNCYMNSQVTINSCTNEATLTTLLNFNTFLNQCYLLSETLLCSNVIKNLNIKTSIFFSVMIFKK